MLKNTARDSLVVEFKTFLSDTSIIQAQNKKEQLSTLVIMVGTTCLL